MRLLIADLLKNRSALLPGGLSFWRGSPDRGGHDSFPLALRAGAPVSPEDDRDLFDVGDAIGGENNIEQEPVIHRILPVLIEDEIAERVVDVLAFVYFVLLHHVRV